MDADTDTFAYKQSTNWPTIKTNHILTLIRRGYKQIFKNIHRCMQ